VKRCKQKEDIEHTTVTLSRLAIELFGGLPQSAEASTATPSPFSTKAKLAQGHAQLAGMNVPPPAAAQLGLQGHEREAFGLHGGGDRRQQPGEPVWPPLR
jgi:hypothetical protein